MSAVLYCRVSTKEQVQNLSLSTQERTCRQLCERMGWDVDAVFVDPGESAKTIDRPKFNEMLEYCRKHRGRVETVVVHAFSRFSRSMEDYLAVKAMLLRYGVTIRSATEATDGTPSGKLVEGIMVLVAQHDNDQRAHRTKEGMAAAIRAGRWPFLPPIGFVQVGSRSQSMLEPDPERAPLILEAFNRFATGRHSKREVLLQVTALGLRTVKGRKLTPQTFDRILRNPIYAGTVRVEGWKAEAPAAFPSLVPRDVFERVGDLLRGRRVAGKVHAREHPDFPLRRFVRCGSCSRPLTASWSTGRGGRRYPHYHCPTRGCGGTNVARGHLHSRFEDYLRQFQPKPEYARLFRAIVEDVWRGKRSEALAGIRAHERRLAELTDRRDRIVDAQLYGRLPVEICREQLDRVGEDLLLVRMELNEARTVEMDVEGVLSFAEHVLLNAARLWGEASPEQQTRLQRALFPDGVTYSDSGFGTAATCLMFNKLQVSGAEDLRVASPTGFEPVSPP